ncbi:MAG: signal peptidase I [Planctomycetes bacterium]|nr:signal peptidase I [Planctomycetota bacterium]
MFENSEGSIGYPERRRSASVETLVGTLELIVTALILAFVFRAYVVEAFRIPTGSMADTLCGSHYHLRCVRCGYEYDVGGDSYGTPQPRCPSCGYSLPAGMGIPVSNGDRILVLKCLYKFMDPKRWDVIVFKNPVDPQESYIKRCVALPGEALEIVDGDIVINGQIARKPPKVQEELWMTIYNNDYQMLRQGRLMPGEEAGDEWGAASWRQPFENDANSNSNWDLNAHGPTVFALKGDPDEIHRLTYNSSVGNDFRAAYAYNDSNGRYRMPFCSDLMVRFDVRCTGERGRIGVELTKYGVVYRGSVDFEGVMRLEKIVDGRAVELEKRAIEMPRTNKAQRFRLANVDHVLVLEFGDERLRHDLGAGPYDIGDKSKRGTPAVAIFGAGEMRLWHIGIFRDIHYTGTQILRAKEGEPFHLGPDEFFACGDNSPISLDSRMWASEGIGNGTKTYTKGVVPRDYLMGKAFFVYWSDAFKPIENLLPIIPNMGGMQFIYGGSDKEF